MKSRDLLEDFTEYCNANPDLRFWQALRNWCGFSFVLVTNAVDAKRYASDTFYWEAKNGLKRRVDAE